MGHYDSCRDNDDKNTQLVSKHYLEIQILQDKITRLEKMLCIILDCVANSNDEILDHFDNTEIANRLVNLLPTIEDYEITSVSIDDIEIWYNNLIKEKNKLLDTKYKKQALSILNNIDAPVLKALKEIIKSEK